MVNKPHQPRNGKKTNKNAASTAATANNEDTSFIVFSNDKSKKDARVPPRSNGAPANDKSKASAGTPAKSEAEKRVDTRTLIAGASWTGKLPMTMFNELCQKQKWEKPEYTTHRKGQGFTGAVLLRQKNVKTQEITTLPPILPPKDYEDRAVQPSAVEARHFAAAYALFRVGNAKSIHMMLPPQYRDLWKGDFEELRRAAIAQGQGYLYEADPFLAKRQHEEAKAAKEKGRAAAAKRLEEEKKHQVVGLDGEIQDKGILKGWQRAPRVEMGVEVRREVESLLRSDGVWNSHGRRLNSNEKANVVAALTQSGFRKSHVEEASSICKDLEECLEWLLVHVPEDDLPKWTLPENYLAGVSLASSNLAREAKLKRLAIAGYSCELCAQVLDSCDGNEEVASKVLQDRLLARAVPNQAAQAIVLDEHLWDEEQVALEAIFGDRFHKERNICSVVLETKTPASKPISVIARCPGAFYPNVLPILTVDADLPAHIRLSLLKQCLLHAEQHFLGEQMLFNILDWFEHNTAKIILHPGQLKDIANATSAFTSRPAVLPPLRKARQRQHPKPISWTANSEASQRILHAFNIKATSPEQVQMLHSRQRLPAWRKRDDIVASVVRNQVTIISGETGSGKSTQSVQFILDDLISRCYGEHVNIICTQPRRISALGLADRVAEERCSRVGDEIGYAIRGESRQTPGSTKICFVTTGVLLRRLQTSGGSSDDVKASLANVSHVVIDEVHERSLDTDFLLAILRNLLSERKDFRLVLMSATLDASIFKKYFENICTVGNVEIEGRTHPVEDIYLDDLPDFAADLANVDVEVDSDWMQSGPSAMLSQNLPEKADKPIRSAAQAVRERIDFEMIVNTVNNIVNDLGQASGGILIFLPGVAEIEQAIRALRDLPNLWVLPLHASLPPGEQKLVFKKPPSHNRKVVVATNIAETSITIDDIVAVIDSGRVKETSFDPASNMVKLAEVWASRAACKQRRGRAGRVRAGKCYKLFTRAAETRMPERSDPEIMRVPLEQLCLSVRAMGIRDVRKFLALALTPPQNLAVDTALDMLARMGALDGNEVTALGWHLSRIPADLRCGKLMVYGAAFDCLETCITVAAILTVKSPFVNPQGKREESKTARAAFADGQGDLICDLRAYEEFEVRRRDNKTSALRRWCSENFLSHQTLIEISSNRTQYMASLREVGFITQTHSPDWSSKQPAARTSDSLLRAVIAGAFQPNVARIDFPDKKFTASSSGAVELDPEARTIKFFDQGNGRVFIHPSSTLFDAQSYPSNSIYLSYFNKMATSKVFIRDLSPFNVYGLLMFAGPVEIDPHGRGLIVDGWLRMRGWARIGVLVSKLRTMLDNVLMLKIEDPSLDMSEHAAVKVAKRLIEFNGLDR